MNKVQNLAKRIATGFSRKAACTGNSQLERDVAEPCATDIGWDIIQFVYRGWEMSLSGAEVKAMITDAFLRHVKEGWREAASRQTKLALLMELCGHTPSLKPFIFLRPVKEE